MNKAGKVQRRECISCEISIKLGHMIYNRIKMSGEFSALVGMRISTTHAVYNRIKCA